MSGLLAGAFGTGLSRGLIQGILTGSTRQIVWPLVDQLGEPLTDIITSLGGQELLDGIAGVGIVNGLGGYIAILEDHHDELEITDHPVEQGATVTDHAYKLPAMLSMQIGWSTSSTLNSAIPSLLGVIGQPLSPLDVASLFSGGGSDIFIRQVYSRLVALQAQRTLLTIFTGKRVYNNMLLRTLGTRTAEDTEHCLIISATFKEINRARVQTIEAPTNPNAQAQSQDTTPDIPRGQQQPAVSPSVNTSTPEFADI